MGQVVGKARIPMELISVLMPAYNHGKYVEAAVRSVMGQDWPRIELIVVDDGSRDDTWAVLRRLRPECERRFERVVMETQPNQGTCVTVNRLCSMARGRFVTVLASDDVFLPGAFGTLAAPLLADASFGVAVGRNEMMDGDGRRCYWDAGRNVTQDPALAEYRYFDEFIRRETDVDAFGPAFGRYEELIRVNHVANGALIRKDLLDRVLPFTKEAPLEDWWLHLQLAKITRYRMLPEATFRYRWHPTNTAKNRTVMDRLYGMTLSWEERRVESLPDRRWQTAFREAHWSVRRKFGIGRLIAVDKCVAVSEILKVVTLFGREFVLWRRPRNML